MMDTNMSGGTQGMLNYTGNYQGSMEMEGAARTGSVISGILTTVTELLLVALILSLVVGLAVWVKNKYFKESYSKAKTVIGNDPMLKTIFVLATTLIGVIFVLYLLGIVLNGGFSTGGMGIVASWSVAGILTFFVKLLTILFIIALIAFLYNYVKQNVNHSTITTTNGTVLTSGTESQTKRTDVTPDSEVKKD